MPRLRNILIIAALILAATGLNGCVVFRAAGKVVGTTVKTTGKVIGTAADAAL